MQISSQLIPLSKRPKFNKPPQVTGAQLILPDVEIPFHNAEFINNCIEFARIARIKSCVWAGDFVRLETLSSFVGGDKDLNNEVAEVETLVPFFLKPFDHILWIWGNHDERATRKWDRDLDANRVARLFVDPAIGNEFARKVVVSNFYYCYVGDEWIIEHPHATSKVPATAARQLAERENKNVAMAHNHLVGEQQTADAQHIAIDTGACTDFNRTAYYMMRHNTRPKMGNGALVLYPVKGVYHYRHFTQWTDWTNEFNLARHMQYDK